jgi:hypothetical protein
MVGDIIPEWWATSSRNGGRHHLGFGGRHHSGFGGRLAPESASRVYDEQGGACSWHGKAKRSASEEDSYIGISN